MVTTRRFIYQPAHARKKARENRLRQILEKKSNTVQKNVGRNDMQEVYTNIKSIPSYSAKIAKFLRENENHSVHRRIVKKTFPVDVLSQSHHFKYFKQI